MLFRYEQRHFCLGRRNDGRNIRDKVRWFCKNVQSLEENVA